MSGRGGRGGGGGYSGGRGGSSRGGYSGERGGSSRGGYSGGRGGGGRPGQSREFQQVPRGPTFDLGLPKDDLKRGYGEIPIREKPSFYKRPGYGQNYDRHITLITNHYAFKVTKDQYAYHYDVEIKEFCEERNRFVAYNIPPEGERIRKLDRDETSIVFNAFIPAQQRSAGLFWNEGKKITPVSDRFKNLYSPAPLNIIGVDPNASHEFRINVNVEDNESGTRIYDVVIKPASGNDEECEINLGSIRDYYEGRTDVLPKHAISALNIIFKYGLTRNRIQVGPNSLYPIQQNNPIELSSGKILKFGHYQSVKPGSGGLTINIDRTSACFFPDANLLEYLCRKFNSTIENLEFDVKHFMELKSCKLITRYQGYKKTFKNFSGFSRESAARKTFTDENQGEVTVEDYFRQRYNVNLRYPNLPCAEFGGQRRIYIPIELCSFGESQHVRGKLTPDETSEVIRHTAIVPRDRFTSGACIQHFAQEIGRESDEYVREFSIDLSNLKAIRTVGKILKEPNIHYKNNDTIKPDNGKWNLRDNIKLCTSVVINKWIIVSFCRTSVDFKNFSTQLPVMARKMGLQMPDAHTSKNYGGISANVMNDFTSSCKKIKDGLTLIVWIQSKNDRFYSQMKQFCHVNLGVECQCVLEKTFQRMNDQTMANIILKINTKLGGVNQIPETPLKLKDDHVFIIGADVTHSAPADLLEKVLKINNERFEASIAAVVANVYNKDYFRFRAETVVQPKEKLEMIVSIDRLFTELVKIYYKSNGKALPRKIIYYRDGVSEGQFTQVLEHEFRALKAACKTISKLLNVPFSPKITFMIVQKRHHTRVMPQRSEDGKGKSGNVPAGTLIDTIITQPRDFDYFMASHEGIQGTSCPTHYFVLVDENEFTADEIYEITFFLCHTYAKATRSISIPSPVMYAHLAAFKARHFLQGTSGLSSRIERRGENEDEAGRRIRFEPLVKELNEKITVSQNLKDKMYFC